MTRLSRADATLTSFDPDPAAPNGVRAVESVRRALRILRCFSLDDPELGVSDIARRLDMHKSTVHRLLGTLELEGFVHQVGGNRYALGWKLFELGEAVRGLYSTRDPILKHLRRLVDATGETAHLAVLDGGEVLYIEKVESSRPLRMPSAVGKRVAPHCTALGKVFLSGLSEPDLWKYIYRPLQRFTSHTITDPDQLRSEVDGVRDHGWAVDREEIEEGLMCIAGPVLDDRDSICAAVSISGPASRIGPREEEFVAAVTAECAGLSAELGPGARHLSELATPPSAMGQA